MIDLSQSRTRWPWRVKLARGLWTFVVQPSLAWMPKAASPLRVAALRLFGARIGAACLVCPGVRVLMPWNLELQDHVALGEGVNVYNFAPVRIDRMTVVSQFAYLCTGSHDYNRPDMPLTFAPIAIGQQVWIAAGVFVAPGVTVPDGAVVGAMSVVTKSLAQPWAVYAGNPCRYIKQRPVPSAEHRPPAQEPQP